eukprot:scaffold10074_cov176-Amphora_coffeaeformis.AAC.3
MDASDAGDTATNGDDVNSDAPCVPQSKGGVCMLRDGEDSLSTLDDDDDDDANATKNDHSTHEEHDGKHHNSSCVQIEFDTTAGSATSASSFWDPETDLTKQVQMALFHSHDNKQRVASNPSAERAEAEAERLYDIVEAMVELHATA